MKRSTAFLAIGTFVCLSIEPAWAPPPLPVNYFPHGLVDEVQNEETIVISTQDSNVAVAIWRDFRFDNTRKVSIGRTTNGGGSWQDSLITLKKYDWHTDPVIRRNGAGDFYIMLMDMMAQTIPLPEPYRMGLAFLRSTDNGVTWERTTVLEDTTLTINEDKPWFTFDQSGGVHDGNLYVAWTRIVMDATDPVRASQIMFARSTDGGYQFDGYVALDSGNDYSVCGISGFPNSAGTWTQLLVGAGGELLVSWVGYSLDTSDCTTPSWVRTRKSTDGGQTFGPIMEPMQTFGNWGTIDGGLYFAGNILTAVADLTGGPFHGNFYIAYASQDLSNVNFQDYNIELYRSTDVGNTWTGPVYVDDDEKGSAAVYDQFHPQLACNQEGTLVCIFYDQRTDTVAHTTFDVFAAYSFDGGKTFTTNHRISQFSIDPVSIPSLSPASVDRPARRTKRATAAAGTIAEYIGVDVTGDRVMAVWTGTIGGTQDVVGATWTIPFMAPKPIHPGNRDSLFQATQFHWGTAWKSDDDHYRMELSLQATFDAMLFTAESDSNAVAYPNPTAETTYYWRVKAFRLSYADSSEYSPTYRFTIHRCADLDGDGFGDPEVPENTCADDNCPAIPNAAQENLDGDAYGDACDNCFAYETPGNIWFKTGDINENGLFTSADIVLLVSYIFKSGPPPQPVAAAGDANCDDTVTAADVIRLVNHIFKGGSPPCDACAG